MKGAKIVAEYLYLLDTPYPYIAPLVVLTLLLKCTPPQYFIKTKLSCPYWLVFGHMVFYRKCSHPTPPLTRAHRLRAAVLSLGILLSLPLVT